MPKLRLKSPIVEMDGDEMTRVMWQWVKEELVLPFVEVDLVYFDLSLENRDRTDDQVTVDAANAIKQYGVGVKCATITPNAQRVAEYNLKQQWRSPNATIRGILDGTVFRTPILVSRVPPIVRSWQKPITIGRHAYGDVYANQEYRVPGAGKAELVFTPADGAAPVRYTIHEFKGPGIVQGIHNRDDSMQGFARACFMLGYDMKVDVWLGVKDTISKTYDARFRQIFEEEFETNWRARYEAAGLTFFFTLIDDAVARVMRSPGGFLWACKNYDGDVMSDMLASACGSLAMMSSVLVSPNGYFEYEAAHGTVQKHYYRHRAGEETSTNSMALIAAWAGALRKRGELDGTPEVVGFADRLEKAALETVESGIMTADLVRLATPSPEIRQVNTLEFIRQVRIRLENMN